MKNQSIVRFRRGAVETAWVAACAALFGGAMWFARGEATESLSTESESALQPQTPKSEPTKLETPRPEPMKGPQGWAMTVSGTGIGRSTTESKTHTAHAAFALQPKEALVPDIGPNFSATYNSVIAIPEAGTYTFACESEGGTASLAVYSRTAQQLGEVKRESFAGAGRGETKPIRLEAGDVSLTVKFKRTADKAARLRILWSMARAGASQGFVMEPLPADSVSVPSYGIDSAAAGALARHGRVLIGNFGCTRCHEASTSEAAALFPRIPPLLGGVGERLSPDWIRQWITNPQAIKPGCSMPGVLGEAKEDETEAIVHWLVSRGGPFDSQSVASEKSVLDRGREIYHTVGCIACHGALESPSATFGETGMPATVPSSPVPSSFGNGAAAIAGKWKPSALAEFLVDPLDRHPDGRMPSMNLTKQEADLLATYLISKSGATKSTSPNPEKFVVDDKKVEIGRAAFAARGCASCHDMPQVGQGIPSTLKAKPLAALKTTPTGGAGCLDPKNTKTPRYTLSDEDRVALASGIAEAKRSTGAPTPIDRAHLTIEALNCRECHTLDGRGGVQSGDASAIKDYFRTVDEMELGDEGRLPPVLTGVGWKLHTAWLKQVLIDKGRARPYMATRMPQFGERNVTSLADQLSVCDGVWPNSDRPEPKSTDELAAAGRKLVGDQGLNCISCHAFGKLPPAGTPGPNIVNFAERLRYEWWKTYVMDPPRFKAGTRMTSFYATGQSAATSIFGGHADKQTDALWAYFLQGNFAPTPEGLNTGNSTALRVGDKPMVFRVFLKDAGSRGIAVGYPSGVNFAFDAANSRLVSAWKGDFLDAAAAWKGRGGEIATGRGPTEWEAPPGAPLVIAPDVEKAVGETWPVTPAKEAGYAFKSYELDKAGIPTFKYVIGEGRDAVTVREVFGPSKREGFALRREFVIESLGGREVMVNGGKVTGSRKVECTTESGEVTPLTRGEQRWFKVKGTGPVKITLDIGL